MMLTLISSGTAGYQDGNLQSAKFYQPTGLATDSQGELFVADSGNDVIRKISNGNVSTIAGTSGVAGSADGAAVPATFNHPAGVAVDASGSVYVADTGNATIRKISSGGVVSTFAGQAGVSGGADGVANVATFNRPVSLTIASDGNLYVADAGNDNIRKITMAGMVTTLWSGSLSSAPYGIIATHENGLAFVAAGRVWNLTFSGIVTPESPVITSSSFGIPPQQDEAGGGIAVDGGDVPYVTLGPYPTTNNGYTPNLSAFGVYAAVSGQADNVASLGFQTNVDSSPSGLAFVPSQGLFIAVNNSIYLGGFVQPPTIITQPISVSTSAGQTLSLNVQATGAASIQWMYNGEPLAGAQGPALTITNVGTTASGSYSAVVTNTEGAASTNSVAVQVQANSRLINLSSRVTLSSGPLTSGFSIGGSGQKTLLLRGIGPTLRNFGIADALPAVTLSLYSNSGAVLASDAGWNDDQSIAQLGASLSAFPLNAGSLDSAIISNLSSEIYTMQIAGTTSASGSVMAEIYDGDPLTAPAKLANLSTLAVIGSPAQSIISGFIISGTSSETVLIRGIGPTLNQFGISNALSAPVITLFDAHSVALYSNAGWGGSSQLQSAFTSVGAFPLPSQSADAALLVTLAPGAYTAELQSGSTGSGSALLEFYDVP
jgi:hypothetical protein